MPTPTIPEPTVLHHALPVIVVHTALRREFRLAGGLVRAAVTERERVPILGDHLDLLFRQLHHHHELEDDAVWPMLRQRAPRSALPAVDVMEAQHADIERLVDMACRSLSAWRADASEHSDRLADLLDQLADRLFEHLDLEEQVVLPLAERHLTPEEWHELSRRADAAIPRHERALSYGMLQYEGDPRVLASMLRSAPAPLRLLIPRLGRRAYRRHAIAVHGTPTP